VQLSTTGDIYITDEYGEESVDRYNKGADAIMALTQGKVDAVVIDNAPAKEYVRVNEGLKILDTEYAEEDYAIAFAKENDALRDQVDAALKELIEDGTVQTIIDKYIQP
jgi:ABC-type amino acid transport substrate-binding protein